MNFRLRSKINFNFKKIRFILYAFLILSSQVALTQVFIPFGFWNGVTAPLTVSPSASPIYMLPGSLLTFTASGGTGFYNWDSGAAVFGDGGGVGPGPTQTIAGSPTDYTSRATSYSANILILTSGASTINITIQTYDAMSMTPATVTIPISTTQQFNNTLGYCLGTGGACTNATTTWSVVSGLGSISATGLFTASASPGTTVIQAADSIGNTAQSTVTVSNTLTITPPALKIPVYSTMNYSAILGTTPYTFSVFAGGGTIGCKTSLSAAAITAATNPITVLSTAGCPTRGVILVDSEQICFSGITATTFTGTAFSGTTVTRGCNGTVAAAHAASAPVNLLRSIYAAPAAIGAATVRVTDFGGATSDSVVTIVKPTDLVMGYAFACATYNDGSLKCWGENTNGQLGIGSTATIGDSGAELGGVNEFVNLGAGRTPAKVVAGLQHACALLDNSTVKCWGDNAYGQLGIGSTTDSRTPALVNFGVRVPNNIWAFGFATCASFTDNSSVCWGLNTRGQAGQNTLVNITSPPATALAFGGGRFPTKMAGTTSSACALLNDSTVQCWGKNSTNGQLGYGDLVDRLAPSGVAITLGLNATDISGHGSSGTGTTSEGNYCVVLSDATVKCWGRGTRGAVGDNGAADRSSPTATIALGFSAANVYVGREFACARSTTNFIKCWGRNTTGQLLNGSVTQMNSAGHCKTTVTGAHTAAVTTITVGSTTTCPVASATGKGKIVIGTEVICYSGTTATTFTGVTRGCDGTAAAAYVGAESVVGIMSFGINLAASKFVVGGRNGCVLTGGGLSNNDRILCWGNNLNAAAGAQSGLMLFHSTYTGTTAGWIGDAAGEIGDVIPFVNH